MAPGALVNASYLTPPSGIPIQNGTTGKSALLHRSFRKTPFTLVKASRNLLTYSDGQKEWDVFDSSCGASVTSLGNGWVDRVEAAISRQKKLAPYNCTLTSTTSIAEEYARALVDTTGGAMAEAVFYGSGSEAVEAAVKIILQYFKEMKQPTRTKFIARHRSYHGATFAALGLSGHIARRDTYKSVLMDVAYVQPCNPYRDMKAGQTEAAYIVELQGELRKTFKALGPDNVAAFVAEPVVGAALGCTPALPGYFKAMKEVCDEFGALILVDEVMCGMGRCGILHAWQHQDHHGFVPDVQTLGKALGAGIEQISGMLFNAKIRDALASGSGYFNHGHTYQNSPKACAAGMEVLKMTQELLPNVQKQGKVLMTRLKGRLASHPNVGDIRGEGLFIGIEFVKDKVTKEPFKSVDKVAMSITDKGLLPDYGIHVYPGSGSADGTNGDHIIISPAYNIADCDVQVIVDKTEKLIRDFFADFVATIL